MKISGHTDDALGSVTRLGDFLLFGQVAFKAGGNNYFTQIALIDRQFL